MRMVQNNYMIHYQDGRVEGPLGVDTIRDLLRTGRLSVEDGVTPPGGTPIPIAAIAQFRAMVSRGPRRTPSRPRQPRPHRSGPRPQVASRAGHPRTAPRRPDTPPLSGASASRSSRPDPRPHQPRPKRGRSTAHTSGATSRRSGPNPDFGLWGAEGEAREARPAHKSKPTPKRPRSKQALEKQRRLERFKRAAEEESGDPFTGPLAWGVGSTSRGVKHALFVYAGVFLLSFMLVSVFGMGTREFEVVSEEPMIFVRGGLLLAAGLFGLMGLRKERLARIGLTPRLLPALVALPVAVLIGLVAVPITRLNIAAGSDVGVIAGLLLLRALGECVFFHGFITRTLLVELKEPMQAIFISALLYGFYALTFVTILGGSPLNVIFGILVYGFGAGMPLAVIYWRTRSVFAPIACHFVILMMVAMAGLQQAERLA